MYNRIITIFKGSCKIMSFYPSKLWKKISGLVAFVLQYAFPVFCFAGCYIFIIKKLSIGVSIALL